MSKNKVFNVQERIGKAKYVVNFFNGIKKHSDGSNFFDMVILPSKKEVIKFTNILIGNGYRETI